MFARTLPRRVMIPALLGALTVWALACNEPGEPVEDPAPPPDPSLAAGSLVASVETVALGSGPFREVVELVGETAPIRSAVVASEAPGRITRLEFDEGDRIERGDVVLRVDTSPQSAQIDQLRAQRRQAEVELARSEELLRRGLGTQAQVDQLTSQIEILDESISQVRVTTRQATTRAPMSGIVTARMAEVGEYASPGNPVLRIVDLSTIVVHVGLPEREIASVHEGMEVQVRILATGEAYRGVLHRIGVEANVANRTFPLEIRLDNADGALRAGMRASVTIEKNTLEQAVIVPRDAILQNLEGREVFVVEDGVALRRDVRTGPGRLGWVVVLDGVAPGAELIVRGQRSLVHGEPVSTVSLGTCCSEQLAAATGLTPAPQADTPPADDPHAP